MSGLNSRLIAARIALVESKAKLEHGQDLVGRKAARATPDNDVITRLRAQYLELGVAANEMESRVGPDHNAVIKIRKRMERLARRSGTRESGLPAPTPTSTSSPRRAMTSSPPLLPS